MNLPTKNEIISAFGKYAEFYDFTRQDDVLLAKPSIWIKDKEFKVLQEMVRENFKGEYSNLHRGFLIPCRFEEPPKTPPGATFTSAINMNKPGTLDGKPVKK